MTDSIKTRIDEPVLHPEIFLEISPNEIGSYKINNLGKKFMEFNVPERKEVEKEDVRAATLTQMMMGML